ncbi:MAG: RibD family protein [Hyphomicrobiaceae bacterium]
MSNGVRDIPSGSKASLERLGAPGRGQPVVVAQLGQSLDGRIAIPSGESRYINGEAALAHLHALRAHVDAVVIGVGTAVVDNPKLNVRLVEGADPARVVIDPSGRMTAELCCMSEGGVRRFVVRADDAIVGLEKQDGVEEIRLQREGRFVPPRAIVEALAERGMKRVLIEGGAATVSAFVDAGVVDRLHVLVAPMLLGSGKPGLLLDPIAKLSDALRPKVDVSVLEGGDVLFDCDLV